MGGNLVLSPAYLTRGTHIIVLINRTIGGSRHDKPHVVKVLMAVRVDSNSKIAKSIITRSRNEDWLHTRPSRHFYLSVSCVIIIFGVPEGLGSVSFHKRIVSCVLERILHGVLSSMSL